MPSFQCGFCGAEFKTKEKLKQHQFSNHGSSRSVGLAAAVAANLGSSSTVGPAASVAAVAAAIGAAVGDT